MGRKYQSILETIGNTPVVRINRLAPQGVNLFVKIEAFNPLGSVKDRLALGVIEAAEKSGELKPGQTVIEATSGNTGIGLAMVCAAKGYPLVLTMAEPFSVERRKLMRFLGAKVIITPAAERAVGMVNKTIELAKAHGWFMTRQFENEANPDYPFAHHGARDHRRFRRRAARLLGHGLRHRRNAERRRRGCSPRSARKPRSSSASPTMRRCWAAAPNSRATLTALPAAPHPTFKPHPMQGWTPDFIPKLTDDAVDDEGDRSHPANHRAPKPSAAARSLRPRKASLSASPRARPLPGALKVAAEAEKGANILCMLPDTGERYLSTPLFADVSADMNEEELRISRSTPGAQMPSAT